MWIFLHCFHRIYGCRKTLLDQTNLFFMNYYEKNENIIFDYFNDKYWGRTKSGVQIKKNFKNDETRKYLLDEMKHDLMI